MQALQYIYTSWKNGDSTEKGYMIYSRSRGITEEECTAIKDAMQYMAPKELNLTPSAQEITDVFPYGFASFRLPGGRNCVAQSTYLGKDYSGRFGNYIIYALVFEPGTLTCRPGELFAEPYMKTFMTEEELAAPSPVPSLPPLFIEQYGSVINDEQLNEFLMDREEEFAQLISLVLAARDAKVPFYLNDTRENLVLWCAALQRLLPHRLALKFGFHTYVGDHESLRSPRVREEGLDFHVVGVRPDANYFNYATEYRSSRHMVMDFLGGHMTEGVPASRYAQAMASSMTMDFEEVNAFGEFLEDTSFDRIDGSLADAWQYYRLLKYDELEGGMEDVGAMIRFGQTWCREAENSDVGSRLLVKIQESTETLPVEDFVPLWKFICSNTAFMIYTLYDLLQETMYQLSCETEGPCEAPAAMLAEIRESTPAQYEEFLKYLNSSDGVDQLLLYLGGHPNRYTNSFYINWLLDSYSFEGGLNDRQPISKLFRTLLNNLCTVSGSEEELVRILRVTVKEPMLFASVLTAITGKLQTNERFERLCRVYVEAMKDCPPEETERLEQMMFRVPKASLFTSLLCGYRIMHSRKPEDEFWRFLKLMRNVAGRKEGLSIGPMIVACLGSLEGQTKEKAALRMLEQLQEEQLQDEDAIRALTDVLDGCGVKTLEKMDQALLRKAYQLHRKVSRIGFDKVRAVLIGRILREDNERRKRPASRMQEIADERLSLADFERADYEAYIKCFQEDYMRALCSAADVRIMLGIFYRKHLFPDAVSEYIGYLKRLEKKDSKRLDKIAAWTSVYLLEASAGDPAAEELYKPFLRYLRSYDREELEDVKRWMKDDVSEARCGEFFEEVQRKEGIHEKLGGFFRRK